MSTLLIDAEKYVFNLLNNKLATIYVYHNLAHTQKVIEKTTKKLCTWETWIGT